MKTISRKLCYVLRHSGEERHLQMDTAGFVRIDRLVDTDEMKTENATEEDIRRVVRGAESGGRFEHEEKWDGDWIRAKQGHTVKAIEAGSLYEKIGDMREVGVCYHATVVGCEQGIEQHGILRMKRRFIHLTRKNAGVGTRKWCNMFYIIRTEKCAKRGIEFYRHSEESETILTEGPIPSECLRGPL